MWEIKSRASYSGAYLDELCRRVLELLQGYEGLFCIESFDPRGGAPHPEIRPRRTAGTAGRFHPEFPAGGRRCIACLCDESSVRQFPGPADFIAWCPAPRNSAVRLAKALGAMIVYWTALPTDDTARLEDANDAVIFQWYLPTTKYQQ